MKRGFSLILVLLLLALLVTVGMAFMGRRSPQYEGAHQAALRAQAQALAEAGLEDARVKLEKDLRFPPPGDRDQVSFTYSEAVYTVPSPGELVGYYVVNVNTAWAEPYNSPTEDFPALVTVVSTGVLGADMRNPRAVYRLKMEVEVDASYPPAAPMRITDWVEEGSVPDSPPPAPF